MDLYDRGCGKLVEFCVSLVFLKGKEKMNVFDFDNTIYDGESSLDFFVFCVKRKPSLARHLPGAMAMVAKYKRGIVPEKEVMEFCAKMLLCLVPHRSEIQKMTDMFWKKNRQKLKPEIMNIIHDGDVIISASPSFMFDNIRDIFENVRIISTEIELESGKIKELCYGANKADMFRRIYPGVRPDNFYTDNINDMPMIQLSERAWLVEGTALTEI